MQRVLADAQSPDQAIEQASLALLQADKLGYIDKIRSIRASASTKRLLALHEDPAAAQPRQKPSSQACIPEYHARTARIWEYLGCLLAVPTCTTFCGI